MTSYPKQILNIDQQIQTYKDAGLSFTSEDDVKTELKAIGYYRLRGYSTHFYDAQYKAYRNGTDFKDIMDLYHFDVDLSHLLFKMTTAIEVALRARLSDAMLIYQDALIWTDPSSFADKKLFWKNFSTISSEIARSSDVFIRHHYQQYDGVIPVWAAVEVMSFGALSKMIKNLKTGSNSAYSVLANHYSYTTQKGHTVNPSKNMLSSWIHSVTMLRNACAHNSRIYGRTFSTSPEILHADKDAYSTRNGLYQIILAMKYLRPNDTSWKAFVAEFQQLLTIYTKVVDLSCINFPTDWYKHFIV